MNQKLMVVLLASLLIVTSGCLGFASSGTQSTVEKTQSDAPTTSQRTTQATCSEVAIPYNLSAPSKPDNISDRTAESVVENFDEKYATAKANHDYDNVTVTITGQSVSIQQISGGYEVTVETDVQISGTDDGKDINAKYGYPTTYKITDRMFARNDTTFSCW